MEIKSFVIQNPENWSITEIGWGNGYAALPKGHPCFGMQYDDIHEHYEIQVHGGLTFSRPGEWCKTFIPEELGNDNFWIVGFDTRHYGDSLRRWPKEKVEQHAAKLAFRFFEIWLEQERKKSKN